jgi:hypothetical protein
MPTYIGERTFVGWTEYVYRQNDGMAFRYRERGIPSVIDGRARQYQQQGYDVYTFRDGPYSNLSAQRHWPSSSSPGVVTRWSVATEILDKSIWSKPEVIAKMETFPQASGGWAGYRKGIEDAVDQGLDEPTWGTDPTAASVIIELRRGAEAYEFDYLVLSRTVTFDFRNPIYGTLQLPSNRYIYTTDTLKTNESIPSEVLFVLPNDTQGGLTHASYQSSANPTGYHSLWGWRIRDQVAEITNRQTGSHTTSWVYARWSTFLYEPA